VASAESHDHDFDPPLEQNGALTFVVVIKNCSVQRHLSNRHFDRISKVFSKKQLCGGARYRSRVASAESHDHDLDPSLEHIPPRPKLPPPDLVWVLGFEV
jgi:hypothetical protein